MPAAYALTDLGSFAGTGVTPYDINEAGQVVGTFTTRPGSMRAFLWDDGVLTELPTLGGPTSAAYDINDLGQVVGMSAVTPGDYNTRHPFLWDSANGMQDLGAFMGSTWSGAAAINDAGQIVGNFSWPDRTRTFLWDDGVYRDLFLGSPGDINEAGVVAGAWESTRRYPAAALWDPQIGVRELPVFFGSVFSGAYALNDVGQVVGYADYGDEMARPVLWDEGQIIDLGRQPNVSHSYAYDINNAGQVVGEAGGPFLWEDGVMQNLNDLVPQGSGLTLAYPNAINDAGQIVATAYDAQGVPHAVLLNPLPADTPLISIGDVTVTEGNTGTRTATFTVTLSTASGRAGHGRLRHRQRHRHGRQRLPGRVRDGDLRPRRDEQDDHRAGQRRPARRAERDVPGQPEPARPAAVLADGQGVGTIVDDEPRISISDVSRKEGNSGTTLFVFTVTLSAASDVPVTVNFATANGTAKAGEDYDARSGTLTFAPGETSKTITIVVRGDKKNEADETFFVNLSGAIGALILDGRGVGTILDDDRR